MKIQVRDLVRLRNDIKDFAYYEKEEFYPNMKFKGFKMVDCVYDNGAFSIEDSAYEYTPEMIAEVKRPTTIYKRKEILDKEEKKYLSAVIKPFRDNYKITITTKATGSEHELRFLSIVLKNKNDDFYKLPDELCFPNFKKGTMYKGMKPYKDYTLEELGL